MTNASRRGLAIICTAVLAGCAGPSQGPDSSALPTSPAPPSTHAVAAGPGAERPANQIPWDTVGPGWILATWSLAPNPPLGLAPVPGEPTPDAPVTLSLLDPAGGRYAITTIGPSPATPGHPGQTPKLVDWSGDGRRAVFEDEFAAGGHEATMTEVDLASGAQQTFTAGPCCSVSVAYTRPSGHAILRSNFDESSGDYKTYRSTLERAGLDGAKQLTFPTDRLGAAGKFNGAYLQSPDGGRLVLGTDNGMAVMGNDGLLIRELPMPAPRTACRPVRWWTIAVILAACDTPVTSTAASSSATQLWQVPLTGGTPSALTPVNDQDLGYQDAWNIPGGTVLQDVPGCGGDGMVFRLTPGMRTTQLIVPGVDNKKAIVIIGAIADKLVVRASTGCGSQSRSLLSYDPVTNTAAVMLDGDVKRAILYPSP